MYFSEADVIILRWAYKKARELARRMASYRGEFKPGHPKFPEGGAVECKPASGPVEGAAADYKYSAEDDKLIDEYHRQNGLFIYWIWMFSNALLIVSSLL